MVIGRVTVGTGRNHSLVRRRMLAVAVAAMDLAGMGRTLGGQLGNLIGVTGAALLSRRFTVPLIGCRLMGIMTAEAVAVGHLRTVLVMARQTVLELTVPGAVLLVTRGTVLLAVQARCPGHGGADGVVTTQAGRLGVLELAELRHLRRMGVMTALAAGQLIMGIVIAVVALATGGNHGVAAGRMLFVTAETAEFGLVGTAEIADLLRRLPVTLYAVGIGKRNGNDLSPARAAAKQKGDEQAEANRAVSCDEAHHDNQP